ncbi:MAG: cytochrome c oxidase, subunit, partial [Pseudonocardiales bacterium]|nr:cytochrome c oxidase, subunit [Pseudonocardiales bacterium]
MTTTAEPTAAESPEPLTPRPIVARPFPVHEATKGSLLGQMLRTTDHKLIGRMYLVTSLIFFALGGVMALLMRIELARPGMQYLTP